MQRLLDLRMNDGSRHFGSLPFSRPWGIVRDHAARLAGARLSGFVTDGVTEAWIDFELAGQHFTVNNQFGEFWLFVADPACPDSLLRSVLAHFSGLLGDA